MRLGISSAALSGAGIEELLRVCERRGMPALELQARDCSSDAHTTRAAVVASTAEIVIAGVLADDTATAIECVGLAGVLAAPVVVGGAARPAERMACAERIHACGADAAMLVSGPAAAYAALLASSTVPLVWQIDATCPDPAADAGLLLRARDRLRYVRLVGGGPEAVQQEGRGIGEVVKQLALAGYGGSIVLAPSSDRYRVVWAAWLGRRGWGCGSSRTAGGPATLHPAPHPAGATRA